MDDVAAVTAAIAGVAHKRVCMPGAHRPARYFEMYQSASVLTRAAGFVAAGV